MADVVFTLGGDTTAGIKAVDALADYVGKVVDDIGKGITFDLDTEEARKGVDLLGDAYDQSQKAATASVDVQRKALAALIVDGKQGGEAFDKIAQSLVQSRQEAKQLEAALAEVDQKILKIEQDAESNFLDKFFKAAAVGQAAEALGTFSDKAIASRDAMANMAAQTGVTGEELERLGDAADQAFLDGVGSIQEATKAIATTEQLLGNFIDESEFDDVAAMGAAIGQVWDKDVNEVIGKSRTFIAQFGLSGTDALNLVSLGMQQAGTAMDDLLDTTDEYSQLLKQAGYSAESSMGLLIEGVQAGTRDTDKLADTIKETQIRIKAGDTDTALAEIATPITETIQGIVRAGQQGQLSIKEVLSRSAGAIEEAFDAGQISEQMRSKLQVAISGTPAEDIGSEIYARIFTADIDEAAIRERATQAGAVVRNALGPVTFFEKAQKEVELLATKAGEFFAPVTAGAAGAASAFSQFAPALSLIDEKFGVFSKVGDVLGGLGPKLLGLIPGLGVVGATGQASFFGIQVSATAAWAAATAGIALVIAGVAYFLTQTEAGQAVVASIGEGFNVAFTYVSAFASNAGEIIGALWDYAKAKLNPASWFGDDTEAEAAATKRLASVIAKSVKGAEQELAKGELQEALAKATDINAKIKVTADTDTLIKNYEAAAGRIDQIKQQIATARASGDTGTVTKLTEELKGAETQAANLASRLAEDVPQSVTGVQTVVSETGELVSVYSVSTDKAKEFNEEQKKSYSSELLGQQKAYSDGLKAQADELADQEAQLNAIGDQIAKNGATPELLKQYDELKGKIGESRKELEVTFKDGARNGLLTAESTGTIAKAFKTSEEEAKKLLEVQKAQSKEAKDTAFNIANLAQSFNQVKAAADASLTQQVDGLKEVNRVKGLTQKQFDQEYAAAATQQGKDNLQRLRNASKAEIEVIRKEGEERRRVQQKIEQASARADFATSPDAKLAVRIDQERADAEAKKTRETRAALDIVGARERDKKLLEIQQEFDQASAQLGIEALEKKVALLPEERTQLVNAKKALSALLVQQDQARIEQQRGFEKEDLDRRIALEQKNSDALASAMEASFDELQATVDSQPLSVARLEELLNARLDLIRDQGARELLAFVEGTQEFAQAQVEINLRIQAGELDAEGAYAELQQARERIAQKLLTDDDDISKAYRAKGREHARAEADAYTEETKRIDLAKLEAIEDRGERERAIATAEARATYEEDLRMAGENNDKKLRAFIKYRKSIDDAERQFAEQSSELADMGKSLAYSFAENIGSAFGSSLEQSIGDARAALQKRIDDATEALDGKRNEEIDKELQKIADEESALFDSLRNREISYAEYLDKLNGLDDERRQLMDDKNAAQVDKAALFWNKINVGLMDSFAQVQEQHQARLDDSLNSLSANFSQMAEDGKLDWENLWSGTEDVLMDAAGVATASAAQMILAGEKVFHALGKAALGTLLDVAEKIILVNTGPIISTFVSWLGPLGIPAALGAIAVAMTALQAGKAAVQGFELGGLIPHGERMIRVNEAGQEYVVNAGATSRHADLLDHINAGGDPFEHVLSTESAAIEAMIRGIITDDMLPGVQSYIDAQGRIMQASTREHLSERLERIMSREHTRTREVERIIERQSAQPSGDGSASEIRAMRREMSDRMRSLENTFATQFEHRSSFDIRQRHEYDFDEGKWYSRSEQIRHGKLSKGG